MVEEARGAETLKVTYYDLSPFKHHKRKWMPLILHFLIECVTVRISKLLDPKCGNKIVGIFANIILGFNTNFPSCCVVWYSLDDFRRIKPMQQERERAAVDIALAIDDFWSGYLPCPRCAASWLNGDWRTEPLELKS